MKTMINDNYKEGAMKTLMSIIAFLGATASLAIAGEGAEENGSSLLVILFLGLGALIVICQLIPSLMLFCSMMKGLFGKEEDRKEQIIALTPELGLTMADGGHPVMKAVKKTIPVTDETEEMSD